MNVFDHDTLFEQIGFTQANANQDAPSQYSQNLVYAAMPPETTTTKSPAGGNRLGEGQPTYDDASRTKLKEHSLSSASEGLTQEHKDGRNMTLGQLLSKHSHDSKSQASSVGHDSNRAVQKAMEYSQEDSLRFVGQDRMRQTEALAAGNQGNSTDESIGNPAARHQQLLQPQYFAGAMGTSGEKRQEQLLMRPIESGPSLHREPGPSLFAVGQNVRRDDKETGRDGQDQASHDALRGSGEPRDGRPFHAVNLPSSDHISHVDPTTTETFKKELMKVTIDLGGGVQEAIVVREGETPDVVARAFASKFDLTQETEVLLREQIELNLAQLQLNSTQGTHPASRQAPTSQTHESKARLQEESDGEVAEAESDEERARITNINSMDPLQWSIHRQGAQDYRGKRNRQHGLQPDAGAPVVKKEQANIFVQDDFTYSSGAAGTMQQDANQPEPANFGARLYYRAINQLGNRQQAIEIQRQVNAMKELEGATFQPQTTAHYSGSKTARTRELRPEEVLIFQGQLADERKKKLKKDYGDKEMEGVTFHPAILKRSEEIIQKRNQRVAEENVVEEPSGEKFKELYRDARLRQDRRKRVAQMNSDAECTFQPTLVSKRPADLVDSSSQRLQTELATVNAPIQEVDEERYGPAHDVFERMAISAKELPGKRKGLAEKVRQEEEARHNFRPQTGRAPKTRKKQVSRDGGIGNHLYQKGQLQTEEQARLKRRLEDEKQTAMQKTKEQNKNKTSERLLQHKIHAKLSELFDAFDADRNGRISTEEVNLDHVSAEILEIFTPLFVELENLGETLDREEFVDSAHELYQTLDIMQKEAILHFAPEKETLAEKHANRDATFAPQINKKSQELVQNSELLNHKVEERLAMYLQLANEKLARKQKEQLEVELADCSFKPQISDISNQIANSSRLREQLMSAHDLSGFSIEGLGNPPLHLHDLSELQQSPNFQPYPQTSMKSLAEQQQLAPSLRQQAPGLLANASPPPQLQYSQGLAQQPPQHNFAPTYQRYVQSSDFLTHENSQSSNMVELQPQMMPSAGHHSQNVHQQNQPAALLQARQQR